MMRRRPEESLESALQEIAQFRRALIQGWGGLVFLAAIVMVMFGMGDE